MTTYYSKEHEWIRVEGDIGVVGITKYAADKLGDVVYAELPATGKAAEKDGVIAVVESVKAASEVYAPVNGEVTEANDALADAPEKVNEDPEGEGWFFKMSLADSGELSGLMDEAAYKEFIAGLD